MKAFVYFNLHKRCWSIRAKSGPEAGRVVAHATSVALTEAFPKVSEAGRQRVLRDHSKNVHAGLVGDLAGYVGTMTDAGTRAGLTSTSEFDTMFDKDGMDSISYNPYKGPDFTVKNTGNPIRHQLDKVVLSTGAFATISNKES